MTSFPYPAVGKHTTENSADQSTDSEC